MIDAPPAFTPEEVAARWQTTAATIRMIHKLDPRFGFRVRGTLRIRRADVEWVESGAYLAEVQAAANEPRPRWPKASWRHEQARRVKIVAMVKAITGRRGI